MRWEARIVDCVGLCVWSNIFFFLGVNMSAHNYIIRTIWSVRCVCVHGVKAFIQIAKSIFRWCFFRLPVYPPLYINTPLIILMMSLLLALILCCAVLFFRSVCMCVLSMCIKVYFRYIHQMLTTFSRATFFFSRSRLWLARYTWLIYMPCVYYISIDVRIIAFRIYCFACLFSCLDCVESTNGNKIAPFIIFVGVALRMCERVCFCCCCFCHF